MLRGIYLVAEGACPTGLVGRSLMALMLLYLDVAEGVIVIEGADIHIVSHAPLRRVGSYVRHET